LADRNRRLVCALYWESFLDSDRRGPDTCGMFYLPKEIFPVAALGGQRYTKLIYSTSSIKGGHFAAFEQPEMFRG